MHSVSKHGLFGIFWGPLRIPQTVESRSVLENFLQGDPVRGSGLPLSYRGIQTKFGVSITWMSYQIVKTLTSFSV